MLRHYASLALRNLRRAPLASAVNVLTLALGLACFVTTYAFVAFWDSAEQHFANADRIAVLTLNLELADGSFSFEGDPTTPEVAAAYLKSDFPNLERVARAIDMTDETMVSSGERSVRLVGAAIDPEFLEIFDLPFVAGDQRTALRAPRSVIVTEEYAAQLFGDQEAIGRTLVIGNAIDATVTGVVGPIPEPSHMGRSAAASFRFDLLASFDVLEESRRLTAPPGQPAQPEAGRWLNGSGRTYILLPADGSLSVEWLREQLPAFTARHVPPELSAFATIGLGALPVRELLANGVEAGFVFEEAGVSVSEMLLALGGLVLGVACVNYANLATARAARRAREVGLRKALGARPTQIMLQHLFEAAILTGAALLLALLVFQLMRPGFRALMSADLAPTLFSGAAFWVFLLALTIGVTLAAGAYPALVLSRVRPVSALRASQRQLGPKFMSTLLVGGQFAVASGLLIAVAVTWLQNQQLERAGLNPGADPLVVIENSSGLTKVEPASLRDELRRSPLVRGVTEIGAPPWQNLSATMITRSPDQNAAMQTIMNHSVGYDFFSVFDIPLLAGRVFSREFFDTDFPDEASAKDAPSGERNGEPSGKPTAIVIDRAAAAELGFAPPEAAVDEIVYFPQATARAFGGRGASPQRIIGVVETKLFTFFGFAGTKGAMYQLQRNLRFQVVRIAATDVTGGLAEIDAAWRRLAPNVAISRRFLDDVFNEVYNAFARIGGVFSGLALMAFLISITGLFAMATLVAGRRMREIGVRKTFGASTPRMVAMLLASFSKPVIVANLVVWPIGFIAARRYLDTFINPIELTPLPFVLSLVITCAVAWLAVGAQTLRAARARPADVLHYE